MKAKLGTLLKEKNGLRALIFLIVCALLFVYLNSVFTIGDTDASREIFEDFYEQEEESIDVMYMGTSATNRYYNTTKAFHDEGIAAYNLAVMGMPMMFVPQLLDEVEKTQDPQLYIIELRNVLKSKNEVTDAHIRRVTDSMKVSSNKFDAIRTAMEYTEGATGELSNIDDGLLDYYVPIIKYHGRLLSGDISFSDVIPVSGQIPVQGYVLSPKTLTQKTQKESVLSEERTPLAPEMAEALENTLNACDALDKDVFFVLAPYSIKAGDAAKLNTAKDMVESHGYTVLDFNDPEIFAATGIDRATDFYNSKHVNYLGAEKYTDYLTAYIKANYLIPDRRGDEKYNLWEEGYEKYLNYVKDGIREAIE